MQYYGNNYDTSDLTNGSYYIEVKPWTRFWARLLDYAIFITAAGFVYNNVTGSQIIPGTSLWLNMAAIAVWVPLEALLLFILGTTPGKWLLDISVRDESGKKPGFSRALKRSLLVWLCGVLAGIPVLSAVSLINSYKRLNDRKSTIWDSKTTCIVYHNYLKPLKAFTFFALISTIAISQYILPNKENFMLENEFPKSIFDYYGYGSDTYNSNGSNDFNIFDNVRSNAYTKNLEAKKLLDEGKYEEAEKAFNDALDLNPSDDTRDEIFNSMSWLYTSTGDNLKSLEYMEKALEITPNTSIEYSNYGNALYALDRAQEAEDAYRKARGMDQENAYSHYGLGIVYYDRYDYEAAKKEFLEYTSRKKNDADGWIYLGLTCLYGEKDTIKAKEYLDKALKLAPNSAGSIDAMALYYDYTGAVDKARECYTKAISENPDDYDLLCKAADYNYYNGSIEDALKYADMAITKDDKKYDAYKIKANAYFFKDDKPKAVEAVEAMLLKNKDDPVANDIAGDIFYDAYEYRLAIEKYEKAIEKNPMNASAHLGIIGSLYHRKRYSECLSFALEAQKKFKNVEIPWYIGDAYSSLNDSENAISYYEKALELDPENQNIMLSAGWENFSNGNFKKAMEYAENILKIDSSSSSGTNLKESVQKRQRNLADQIAEFIEENYMYFQSGSGFDNFRKKLAAKEQPSTQDILELFGQAYKEGDMFSFVLYDDYYAQYLEMCDENTVESKAIDQDIIYTRISSFSQNTANEFLNVIDNIEAPENKYLVIDLRGNSGGDTNSGCNILDYLLPDCVVCNLIYKNGYSNSYYSDDECIKFKHIFVFADGNSASCSELVTLGLKTYLDNVTVIGARTFGKGVGQIGFEDKEKKLAVFIVNHYWNVREINIMDKGIEPDVPVDGSGSEECMSEVRKLIAAF